MMRLATEQEHKFYHEKLYPLQDEIFKLITSDKFYLTGGTCLSRFYYDHRYSDDLDFFFDGEKYNQEVFEVEFRTIISNLKLNIDDILKFIRDLQNKLLDNARNIP